jgi:hypothetical protein
MASNKPCLKDFVEQISDDFQSTFKVVSDNVLMNLMLDTDIMEVTEIINKYIPDSDLRFTRLGEIGGKKLYFIELKRTEGNK